MTTLKRRGTTALTGIAIAALALTGCSSGGDAEEAAESASDSDYYPVTVTDMAGNEVTIESADSVAVTDNRFFQLAADWDLPVTTAPLDLFSPANPMAGDESILNIGQHGEPDFEQVVAADPDLIINGYRFSEENADGMQQAAPDAAFVDMNNDELTVEEYTVESLTLMGEIFNREAEAETIIEEFNAAVEQAEDAYDPEKTVLGLLTSGGEVNYSNPNDGRGASIYFQLLDLTPALDAEGSENHTGDNVSLEMLAESDADYFLVLDRDAAVSEGGEEATPALELIEGSASLAEVPAVQNGAIYVMPADYYLTEDVFAHIAVLNGLTELFSAE